MRTAMIALAAAALLAALPAPAQGSDEAQIAALSLRVQRLEGARAVKKLQRAFGFYVDRGLWDDAADLFTDHGTIEIGVDGVYVGKARIRDYLKALHGGQDGLVYGQLNEWVTLQPLVDVAADGRSARARWRDLGMLGQYHTHAEWRDGIYENEYVRENGVWRIQSLHLYINFIAPVEKGWARLKQDDTLVPSAVSKALPPDRPPTVRYASFPETQIPAFHGPNPVSGRQAQGSGDIRSKLAAYQQRVTLLEDQDAVENLQATFGYYFDKGLWNQAAALFAPRGSFEYGQRGVYIGPARIQQALLLFGPQGLARGRLNNHMMLQPIIIVAPSGQTATGRFQGMVMLAEPGQNGKWGVGIYENEYVKAGGVWKIARLHFYMTALTDYDLGFAKNAIQMDGPSALFPPDRPPTEVYRSFPSAYLPAFSYQHPVTGQPLRDLPMAGDDITGRPDRGMDSGKREESSAARGMRQP